MKVKMETDYCDAEGYPAKGDILEVIEEVLGDDGYPHKIED